MMNRRAFSRLVGAAVAGGSLSGCVGSDSGSENPDAPPSATTSIAPSISSGEVDTRIRFTDLQWGSHCVPSPCMWSLRATAENLSGESFVFGYVLTVQTEDGPKGYEGAIRIEAWGEAEVLIRTEIPDTELQPTDFELIPVKVEQPVTPIPVPDPESYARIVEDRLELDSITPTIQGVVENVSEEQLSRIVIRGTFYIGDRAAEATNVSERNLLPGEERNFTIRYFRGNQARLVDGHEVSVIEVYV